MPKTPDLPAATADAWSALVEKRYKAQCFASRNRSGIEVRPAYGVEGSATAEWPGIFPYTRGMQ